ncbi:L,D-transpeptidase family protein [Gillisia sp. M10.2A]|uniref:L,D-transpeptidase family protein n=1 Tax=Gillisia lutea TaxID=2909668 RepID=A0ABS9EHQ0_9FLAO|nr:L,D-transpeptidase family protein [Gillisia lutea]MCF4102398.1 L,D-transpeptidase family protein [Gillisia lutea]
MPTHTCIMNTFLFIPLHNTSIKKNLILLGLLLLFYSCQEHSGKTTNSPALATYQKAIASSKKISEILSTSDTLKLFENDSVTAFYINRKNKPVWNNIEFKNSFIDTLKQAEAQGLNFKDYHGDQLNTLSTLEKPDTESINKLDVLLTDAYFKFGKHLLNGKTNPLKSHEIWDLPRNTANLTKLLESAAEDQNIEIALRSLRPNHPIYNQLIKASKEYKKLSEEFKGFKDIIEGKIIRPEMNDTRIPSIQFRLMYLGYLKNIDPMSNKYSEEILAAIKKFQHDKKLLVDGIIGNSTIAMLNTGPDKRFQQIQANLERWRWYPRYLGDHYLLLNIANFQLQVIQNGKVISTNKTIVGKPSRKTPIYKDEIEYIVFNPSWHIPPTIKNNDVIPQARRNASYLLNKKIDVYNSSGEKLDPFKIDWTHSAIRTYTYRQGPGPTNPLGVVKIIYPNKHYTYLHDTPSKDLFNRNSRALSSGCIRVENALVLAQHLLSDQDDMTPDRINEILKKGRTQQIEMRQKVSIYQLYWTAWQESGVTVFANDIYGYDTKIFEELRKAS